MAVSESTPVHWSNDADSLLRNESLPTAVLDLADRHRLKLFLALVVLYAIGFNGQWRLEPDSALYLTIGRNLAEGYGYTYQGEPERLVLPGVPLLFAGTFRLFHTGNTLPALLLMPLIGLGTLALTYRLFLLHAGRPTAVLLTFGLGFSRLFYRYCFELLSDMPFLLGVMAVLVGYEAIFYGRKKARWFDWALLGAGLAWAIAMRPTMWALLLALMLALLWTAVHNRSRRPQSLVCCAAIVVAIALFWALDLRHGAAHALGQYEETVLQQKVPHVGALLHELFSENIKRLFEANLSQAVFGGRLGVGLNTLAGVAILIFAFAFTRHRPLWVLWIGITLVMVLVLIKPLDRYFLEVLPLLVYAWWRGICWLHDRLPQPWGRRAFLLLFLLGATTNLLRTGEFIVEQRWVPFCNHYKEGRFASTDQVVELIQSETGRHDWIIAPPKRARILTFLSRRNVVEPNQRTPLDPVHQPVFLLTPLSDEAADWLRELRCHPGPAVGPEIKGKLDPEPWRLYRIVPN